MNAAYKGKSFWYVLTFDFNRNGDLMTAIFSNLKEDRPAGFDVDILDINVSSSDNDDNGNEYDFVTVVYRTIKRR